MVQFVLYALPFVEFARLATPQEWRASQEAARSDGVGCISIDGKRYVVRTECGFSPGSRRNVSDAIVDVLGSGFSFAKRKTPRSEERFFLTAEEVSAILRMGEQHLLSVMSEEDMRTHARRGGTSGLVCDLMRAARMRRETEVGPRP